MNLIVDGVRSDQIGPCMKPECVWNVIRDRRGDQLIYDLLRVFCQTEVFDFLVPMVIVFTDPLFQKAPGISELHLGIDAGYIVSFFEFLCHAGDEAGIESNGFGKLPNPPHLFDIREGCPENKRRLVGKRASSPSFFGESKNRKRSEKREPRYFR